MKTQYYILLAMGLGAGLLWAGENPSGISSPQSRHDTIEQIKALLEPKPNPVEQLPADFPDPFHPVAEASTAGAGAAAGGAAAKPAGLSSSREILTQLAAKIHPSGVIYRDGVPTLLFREKKLKIGDTLTQSLEGTDYSLEIAAIEGATFTLRLNNEEIVRPIK